MATLTEDDMATLTEDRQARKEMPMARGLLDYFPDALAMVANVSFVGNQQHNPGQEIHWAWGVSNDHADCILRHLVDRGTIDNDGIRHTAKVAWRALALLQEELVAAGVASLPRAARVKEATTVVPETRKSSKQAEVSRDAGEKKQPWTPSERKPR